MNDKQTKTLTNYRGLLGIFNSYEETIANYAPVELKVATFKALFKEIEAAAQRTAGDTTGITKGKETVKKSSAELAVELAGGGFAHADGKGDEELKAIFDLTFSDIRYAKDEDAINLLRLLHSELSGLAPTELEAQLIAPEDLAELEQLTDEFERLEETQGSTKAQSQTAHKQLAVRFREVKNLLDNQLDKLMARLRRKEPELYEDYFNVRK